MTDTCKKRLQGVIDIQDLLNGKWKAIIIAALYYNGTFRFMDLKRHIEGIAPKVLSKELKDLEMNHLIKRSIQDTMPITVEYELTPLGESLSKVIEAMGDWGLKYRKSVQKK